MSYIKIDDNARMLVEDSNYTLDRQKSSLCKMLWTVYCQYCKTAEARKKTKEENERIINKLNK